MTITLQPILKVNGTITLPGSKSISNRVLLLAALASNNTIITNLLDSDDVYYMLNALKILGIRYTIFDRRTRCNIIGNKGKICTATNKLKLFIGNAGTVMRFLTAILCLGKNNVVITGDTQMKKRPIGHLVNALRQGGAQIQYLERECYPPVLLYGGFKGGKISIDGSISSQFITALLMTAPLAQNDTIIEVKGNLVSKPYIDITLYLMQSFNLKVQNQSYKCFIIRGQQKCYSPGSYLVEGDASSASYFLAAAAIKGGTVKVVGIGKNSIQGDICFANILEKMGATVLLHNHYISCTRSKLYAIDMDMSYIPDIAMTIAVVALFASGTTILRNIYHWRFKETDRLFAMTTELRKVGAIVEEKKNSIRITPPKCLQSAKIHTYNDHRIAMCFSLIALSGIPITILNPKCVTKTFPDYFKQLKCITVLP